MNRTRPHKLTDCTPLRHGGVPCRDGVAGRRAASAPTGQRYRRIVGLLVVSAAMLTACDASPRSPTKAISSAGAGTAAQVSVRDSAARQSADSAAALAAVRDTAIARRLSPAADSLVPFLVFVPTEERVLVAAVRNKQWLLDVGRIDVDIRKDSAKTRAFREAAPVVSPIPPGSRFRVWWARGAEDVTVDSLSVYSGRIVMRVLGSPALDSAAKGKGAFAALAMRSDSAMAPVPVSCELRADPDSVALAADAALSPVERKAHAVARKSADSVYDARVTAVRDSLETLLRNERAPYERLQRKTRAVSTTVRGCFGTARRAVLVSLRAGDAEWVRERLVVVPPTGAVTALRIEDFRFRSHDLFTAFDADGDGVDDLAVKGATQRAGGTAVLRVDLAKKRATRLAAGFAWETF